MSVIMSENKDKQIIEVLGRNKLISEILKSRLEVAVPERDEGIDLIVYKATKDIFIAKPIQMKSATKASFSIEKKYSKFKDLILAYIWYIEDEKECVTYALNYEQVYKIAEEMKWTKKFTWKDRGKYTSTKPSKTLKKLLEPYKMNPEKWQKKITE